MKNINKKLLVVPAAVILAGLLAMVGVKSASATGAAASSGATVKPRVNNAVSAGAPLAKEAKGVKVFGADSTATKVVDEAGTAPTTGGLAALEINNANGSTANCYLMVYDSSVAADTTEAGSSARLLVSPLLAVTSGNAAREYIYPKQFHKGLVVLVGGSNPSACRATVSWLRNGNAD